MKNYKIVAIGGGTGLSQLMRGLKWIEDFDLTSIVAVTDEGGSSGIIREEYSIPPPGDLRNNIIALAQSEGLLTKLLSYRFKEGSLKNHSVGNIIILALTKLNGGDLVKAIRDLSLFLRIRGRVLPCATELIRLVAEFDDGSIEFGEMNIVKVDKKIKKVWLDKPVNALPESVEAILTADVIIFGPGSLYTSIITNLLVEDIPSALKRSEAKKIYIANLMTQKGETKGYTLKDHVKEIEKYAQVKMDYVIANIGEIPHTVLEMYKEKDQVEPVKIDEIDNKLIKEDLVVIQDMKEPKIRHDPFKLSQVIENLVKGKI